MTQSSSGVRSPEPGCDKQALPSVPRVALCLPLCLPAPASRSAPLSSLSQKFWVALALSRTPGTTGGFYWEWPSGGQQRSLANWDFFSLLLPTSTPLLQPTERVFLPGACGSRELATGDCD